MKMIVGLSEEILLSDILFLNWKRVPEKLLLQAR